MTAVTLEEARRVLGVEPDEDPASRLGEFEAARERIADLIRQAPNDTIAIRYQEGLQEFDRALAAVREEIERRRQEKVAAMMALVPSSVSGKQVISKREGFLEEPPSPSDPRTEIGRTPAAWPPPKVEPVATEPTPDPGSEEEPVSSPKLRYALYVMIFLIIGGAGGAWLYFHMQAERELQVRTEVAFLEGLGAKLVEGRRWAEAQQAYRRVEELDPGSEIAVYGRRSIEFGMREEQEQFVGYWSGEALAAFEAGRLEDAGEAASKVLARYPNEREVLELRDKIETARQIKVRETWAEEIRSAIESRDWKLADASLTSFAQELPGDDLLNLLAREIETARQRQRDEHARAKELAAAARVRDGGKFDPQVLAWMREAMALAPEDPEIKALYEKVASYSRTLRVPDEVPTLKEALAQVRDRDRIVLAEGSYPGGLSVNVAVQLEGAGEGKTVLENPADDAPVLTFGPGAQGATASGLVFRKSGFDASETRYPGVQLRGAEVSFTDCRFEAASGHGLEVLEGGLAETSRCEFKGNGWDGAVARGKDSRLQVEESVAEGNFGHGFEVWDGGVASISNSVAKRNSRAGILIDSAADGIRIADNEVFGNREYGIVLAAGASGFVRGNSCYANLRGGMVVRFSAISMVVEKNQLEDNQGPGLVLEQGLRQDIYEDNKSRGNRSGNLVSGATFDTGE